LKKSCERNWKEQNCVRMPYKRHSQFPRHFVSPKIWPFRRKLDFFNSHGIFRQQSSGLMHNTLMFNGLRHPVVGRRTSHTAITSRVLTSHCGIIDPALSIQPLRSKVGSYEFTEPSSQEVPYETLPSHYRDRICDLNP